MKDVIRKVAAEYGITPEECRQEIKLALKNAGIDIEPEMFIAFCVGLLPECLWGN